MYYALFFQIKLKYKLLSHYKYDDKHVITNNYNPISLLLQIYIIFEKIIYNLHVLFIITKLYIMNGMIYKKI